MNNIYGKLKVTFENNNKDKFEVLQELCDILESYEYKDYNIENLKELLNILVTNLYTEKDSNLKDKISEAISLVFMYQKVEDFNFDNIIPTLNGVSNFALSNLIEIFGYSNESGYYNLLVQYKDHSNNLVREATYNAICNLCGNR